MSDTSDLMENESYQSQMSGYLYKKASHGEWQRRYFETNGAYLTYYKTHKMTKLLAALSVPQVGAIKMIGRVDDGSEEGIFQIDLKDRQYVLKADTVDEAEKWVAYLIELRDSKPRNTSNPIASGRSVGSGDDSSCATPLSIDNPSAAGTIQKSNRIGNFLCFCIRFR